MTSSEATKTLGLMVTAKQQGNSWAQIATLNGYRDGKAAKRAAKEAARVSQRVLLEAQLASARQPGRTGSTAIPVASEAVPSGLSRPGSASAVSATSHPA